jgi:hypothetical protein
LPVGAQLTYNFPVLVSTIFFILIPTTPAHSQPSGNTLPNIFVTTSEAAATHQILLKAIKHASESGISQVSTFTIDFTNVVQMQQNGSMIVLPALQDPSFQITGARLKDASNKIVNLPRTSQNTFSLQGIATGVYTLDIIAQRGNTQGVYETILVVMLPNQPLSEQIRKAIQQRIEYEIVNVGSILIDPGSEPRSEPVNDPCNYYGLNICDENGDCDSERFDCWSDCRDGSTAVTGQCPGDDDEICYENGQHLDECKAYRR